MRILVTDGMDKSAMAQLRANGHEVVEQFYEPAELGAASMRQEIVGDLAAEILVGESSSLYKTLYEKNLIDSGFSVGYESLKGVAMLTVSGDSMDPDAVAEAILHEADRLAREGLDPILFECLKRSALGRRIRNLDSFSSICYRMCADYFENLESFDFPQRFREADLEQAAALLRRTVLDERMSMVVIRPNNSQEE